MNPLKYNPKNYLDKYNPQNLPYKNYTVKNNMKGGRKNKKNNKKTKRNK